MLVNENFFNTWASMVTLTWHYVYMYIIVLTWCTWKTVTHKLMFSYSPILIGQLSSFAFRIRPN